MRRALSLVVCLAALLTAAACGGGSDSSDKASSATGANTNITGGGTTATANAGATKSASASGSDYCAQAGKQFEDTFSGVDANSFLGALSDPSQKDKLAAQVDQALKQFDQAVQQAPSEIRGDVNTVIQAIRPFLEQLKKANFDITKMDLNSLSAMGNNQSMNDAAQRIADYFKTKCGIDVTSTTVR